MLPFDSFGLRLGFPRYLELHTRVREPLLQIGDDFYLVDLINVFIRIDCLNHHFGDEGNVLVEKLAFDVLFLLLWLELCVNDEDVFIWWEILSYF